MVNIKLQKFVERLRKKLLCILIENKLLTSKLQMAQMKENFITSIDISDRIKENETGRILLKSSIF